MWSFSNLLLFLPSALLVHPSNVQAQTTPNDLQWPYNLPPNVKYYPEHEQLVRRNMEIQIRLGSQRPVGVRKMTQDIGEMFFLEYWHFGDEAVQAENTGNGESRKTQVDCGSEKSLDEALEHSGNHTMSRPPQPPLLLHSNMPTVSPLVGRYLRQGEPGLVSRDFTCPAGTLSCAAISRPNSCCSSGLTCTIITDTGLGDVGCCSASFPCGGQVTSCPAGYTACPAIQGGGCCIPGYQCSGVGCKCTHQLWNRVELINLHKVCLYPPQR